MEFKLLSKTIFGLFILISIQLSGQEKTTLEAFTASYDYEELGEYSKATIELSNIYDEDSYEINLRLGWLLYQAGKFSESELYYQRAVNIMPYSIEARLGLIYPKTLLGKWDEVINIYKEILKSFPHNTLINYKLGLLYYEKEQYEKALECFRIVVELWPFDYDGLLMFAHTNAKLGKIREAKVLYNKVLLLSPRDEEVLNSLEQLQLY